MFMQIEDVRTGDHIVEGREKTRVGKVEVECCSSKGTHINGRECWPRGTVVEVVRQRDQKKEEEESDACPRCGGDHAWCQNVQEDEYAS